MIEKTWKYKHVVGIVSDTHIGSEYSIWPPNFVTDQGNEISQNPAQELYWEYWMRLAESFNEFNCEEIWHMGDLIEGQNHKEQGLSLLTTDIKEQRKAAAMVMEPMVTVAKKWYQGEDERGFFRLVGGTPYHQGATPGQWPEEVVTEKMLGGTFHKAISVHKFRDSERVFMIFHGVGGAFMYPETQAGRELLSMGEAEALGIYEHVDCLICGHLHHAPLYLHKYGQHFIRVGCWKCWDGTRFGFGPVGKKQPKCTAGILMIDESDRIRYIPFDFKPIPKILDVLHEI